MQLTRDDLSIAVQETCDDLTFFDFPSKIDFYCLILQLKDGFDIEYLSQRKYIWSAVNENENVTVFFQNNI